MGSIRRDLVYANSLRRELLTSFRATMHIRRFHPLIGATFLAILVAFGGCAPQSPSVVVETPAREHVRTTGAGLAMEWRYKAMVDEHGYVPADGRAKAWQHYLQNLEYTQREGYMGLTWTERGPRNVSGRKRSLLIHPTNPNLMWSGSVSGGIWKSTDGGANWAPVDDMFENLAIGCMAMTPGNPNVMYAGTGEGFFNIDAVRGAGIFKTTNGGATWTKLANTASYHAVNRIAVSPTDPNNVLAAVRGVGIVRSTDGGSTWNVVYGAQSGVQVLFHPTDGTKALASILDYDFGTSQWFYTVRYSTNSGQTWTAATGTMGRVNGFDSRIELAYAPSNPSIVYASAAHNGKIFRSTNGGESFGQTTTTGTANTSWYNNALFVDPSNADRIVVGGVDIFRSTNQGGTLTKISNGYIMTTQPHPDVHFFAAHPNYNGSTNPVVFVTTDGGTYKSDNIWTANTSSGWAILDNARTTQFYGAAGHGGTGRIYGGTQDNGSLRLNSGSDNAHLVFGGDGGWSAIDPTDANYLYGEYIYLTIHRSTNGGTNANYIYSGIGDANNGNMANFIAPFILDPTNPNRMYAGGARLWRSNNVKAATPSWSQIRGTKSDFISAIAVAPSNANVIWVGYNDGILSKATNGTNATPTFVDIDSNSGSTNPLPNRYITRILVDPANENVVYVALGGYTANNLWRTTNGGTTWTSITGSGVTGLPNAPIRGIARHPDDANKLYVGTEVGIFSSLDGGTTWMANVGPANVSVDELVFMSGSNILLAATHGRGIWTATISNLGNLTINPTTIPGGAVAQGTISIGGNAPAGGVTINLSSSNTAAATVPSTVVIPAGQSSATFDVTANPTNVNLTSTITASLSGETKTAEVTVRPAAITSVTVNEATFFGGSTTVVTGTVQLDGKASNTGYNVALGSSHATVTVPASVTIPNNQSQVDFAVTHNLTTTQRTITLTGTLNGVNRTATVTVNPIVPVAVNMNPSPVIGGAPSSGIVELNAPLKNGATIALSAINAPITTPASVNINAGSQVSNVFNVTTSAVAADVTGKVRATFNGSTFAQNFKLLAPRVSKLIFSKNTVYGGQKIGVTLELNGNAPPGGINVVFASNDPNVIVPSPVKVNAGQSVRTFNINTTDPGTTILAQVTATLNGVTTRNVTVKMNSVANVTFNPKTVVGGSATTVTGTVTLHVAAGSNLAIDLSSSHPSVASVPATVVIPQGQKTATFALTHFQVSQKTHVVITATRNGVSKKRGFVVHRQ
ncbi:MAG: hypothetical protein ACK4XJ_02020 [Fimbriimonadaceae bacterium]